MSPNTIQKHWMRFIFKFSHFAIDWIDPQRSFLLRPPVPLNWGLTFSITCKFWKKVQWSSGKKMNKKVRRSRFQQVHKVFKIISFC